MRTTCGFEGAGANGSQLLVQVGPTLVVNIGFDPVFDSAIGGTPQLAMTNVNALVDTGATESCIDSGLAMQLNLPIIDQRQVGGISGAALVNMHLAQIHVPSLPFTVYGAFAGVDLAAGGQPHLALIGRTFLRHFIMSYNGITGEVTIHDGAP